MRLLGPSTILILPIQPLVNLCVYLNLVPRFSSLNNKSDQTVHVCKNNELRGQHWEKKLKRDWIDKIKTAEGPVKMRWYKPILGRQPSIIIYRIKVEKGSKPKDRTRKDLFSDLHNASNYVCGEHWITGAEISTPRICRDTCFGFLDWVRAIFLNQQKKQKTF